MKVGIKYPGFRQASLFSYKSLYCGPVVYESESPEATFDFARCLGSVVQAGMVIGLVGDLGAGKTSFVQGFARGLDIPESTRIVSPTFTILNEIHGGRLTLYHCDLYRVGQEEELEEIGLHHAMTRGGVTVVEWSDRFDVLLPDRIDLSITATGLQTRSFEILAKGALSETCLESWRALWPTILPPPLPTTRSRA